ARRRFWGQEGASFLVYRSPFQQPDCRGRSPEVTPRPWPLSRAAGVPAPSARILPRRRRRERVHRRRQSRLRRGGPRGLPGPRAGGTTPLRLPLARPLATSVAVSPLLALSPGGPDSLNWSTTETTDNRGWAEPPP
ncbi:unnamed protein product, partial [Prorocentrum cordatum]